MPLDDELPPRPFPTGPAGEKPKSFRSSIGKFGKGLAKDFVKGVGELIRGPKLPQKSLREKPSSSKSSLEEKDMTIFRGKSQIPISKFLEEIRKASPYIPGTGGKMFTEKERREIGNELKKKIKKYTGKTYYLDKKDIPKIIKGLEREKWGKPQEERQEIERKIRWLKRKEIFGK